MRQVQASTLTGGTGPCVTQPPAWCQLLGGEWGELSIYHTQPSVHGALVYVLGNCKPD